MSDQCDESGEESYKVFLKMFENSKQTVDEDPSKWLGCVKNKLYSMFCSPMREEFSSEAFKWVSNLCISIGDLSWIATDGKWTKEDAKIFSCLALLSMNEIHILLPLIQRHLTYGDEPEIENGKLLTRSANSEDYDKFGDHLVIMESVIKTLVKGQELDDDSNEMHNFLTNFIGGAELENLLGRLKEVFTSICEYLEVVNKCWSQLVDAPDSEKFSSADGALRIICVWLSEDPTNFELHCERFLIDLLIKNLLLPNRPHRNDLIILALHSVCVDNEKLSAKLKLTTDFKMALEKYLDYVQEEQNKANKSERGKKIFKLRCGLVKDLMTIKHR